MCPSCGRLVGAQERRCPNCGAWQPGLFGYGPAIQRVIGGQLDLSNAITGTCVVLYVISLALDPSSIFRMNGIFDLLSPSGVSLFRLGMTSGQIMWAGGWWTLCTATFLHGSALHILFNMAIMRRYLPMVADLFGNARAFIIFVVAGAAGFVLSNVVTHANTIGASGAIFGLLGALISYGRRTGQSYVTGQLLTFAILMFVMSFLMSSSVNNWAHAGGFASGWVTAQLMPTSNSREGLGVVLVAGALALLTLAGFVLSFVLFSPMVTP
ncbi:MAG TPA: rhomboid family intramembrane serine protease [Candidatus Acidoferrales bacterium]|nr:rhomboid family intramembrane serine protease [Candidatus Acidoferrales bacterium]